MEQIKRDIRCERNPCVREFFSNDAWKFFDGEMNVSNTFLSSVHHECGSNIVSPWEQYCNGTAMDINVSMERRKFNIRLIHIEQR